MNPDVSRSESENPMQGFTQSLERWAQVITDFLNTYVVEIGPSIGGETVPIMVMALLGTGVYLTIRLGFIQLRRLGHGFAVTTGRYDDPEEPGDVSHFQALTTALSATVGIGNIAGVALAIHLGGPGALFWMWVTAFLGMATKYTEVTLAQTYRTVEAPDKDAHAWEGTVSGGPMYYIERGLGKNWKPMAIFFAIMLASVAFLTGNAVQANTVADVVQTTFFVPKWVTGLVTSSLVALVILGGISRIGKVTGILAPVMAVVYVSGALIILILNAPDVLPTITLIFREAFNPTAGVAGTGIGALLVTMMWGVRRGLFSNEAGQGSAPIAHAAAKTDEPVSEGVVALLEPFIDTIVICTMTGLVLIMTEVNTERFPTEILFSGGDISYVVPNENKGFESAAVTPEEIRIVDGYQQVSSAGDPQVAWHEVAVERLYEGYDEAAGEFITPFTGTVNPLAYEARSDDGRVLATLWGMAPENGAPLTMIGFRRGLSPLGDWGHYIVLFSVMLFAISTAISWSYYGDRSANYLMGSRAVLPYKLAFVAAHFVGAVLPLAAVWGMGDVFLAVVILPNLFALILLAPKVAEMTNDYFQRQPWVSNFEKREQWKREGRKL
jgi:AGCS family alanine or glycine:cation symporter